MKILIRKYWFIGFSVCAGSVTYLWDNSKDDQYVSAEQFSDSGAYQTTTRFVEEVLEDKDTSRFEPVSFERFRPQ